MPDSGVGLCNVMTNSSDVKPVIDSIDGVTYSLLWGKSTGKRSILIEPGVLRPKKPA